MAYRRCLSNRATLKAHRNNPAFSYVLHDDDRKQHSVDKAQSQHRLFGSSFNSSAGFGFINGNNKRYSQSSFLPSAGVSFCRYMSTSGEGSVNSDLMSDITDIFTDTAVQASAIQAPVANEVAIAAADSAFPVAGLQYLIDNVHTFTGLNWWSSIIVTTFLIRGITLPLIVNQLKSTTKLTLMRPRLEEIKQEIDSKGMDPMAVADGQKRMKSLFKEYGVSPFTPLKGLFIQAPIFISFFLAISNMAEKVPSFKTGGAYWFLDLSTPDPFWALPVLTATTFLITVECNMQEGMEGNPMAGTMKNVMRALAVCTVPFTMNFPKALFCYWITSNLFSLAWGLVLRSPGVKKFLAIPEIPKLPPGAAPQNPFDLFAKLKPSIAPGQGEPSKQLAERKVSSSADLSQRVRSLEKKVKGKKKKHRK
ncbi:mitochondrial inner membrane protein OXA1-like [Rutidosis leptorrhynchoides]|uniref:mitochondrial inner membrane protein OXA1-like n=1 Tax=Rutidosis leptorrhynchoides TaxID=125765 RepID=UPI003A98F051